MIIMHTLPVGMAIEYKVLISSHCQELLIPLWSAPAWRILYQEPQSYFVEETTYDCSSES